MRLTVPSFFIPGAQKCGTDSLYACLSSHPDIGMSDPKEPHYFSRAASFRRKEEYLECFDSHRAGKTLGEASASYLAIPGTAGRISEEVEGEPRFVVILRSPVDRVYSSFLHMKKTLPYFDRRSFDEAVCWQPDGLEAMVEEEERRLAAAAESGAIDLETFADFGPHADWNYRYIRNSWYRPQIESFLAHFPQESFLFLLLDDLREEWRTVARRTFEFLHVDPSVADELGPTVRNRTRVPDSGFLSTILAYRWIRDGIRPLTRTAVGSWLKSIVKTRVSTSEYPPMPVRARADLERVFFPEIARLEEVIGRDLSGWRRGVARSPGA